jgi:membrane protein YdbS with pleckstrin-like domain
MKKSIEMHRYPGLELSDKEIKRIGYNRCQSSYNTQQTIVCIVTVLIVAVDAILIGNKQISPATFVIVFVAIMLLYLIYFIILHVLARKYGKWFLVEQKLAITPPDQKV